MAYSVPKLTEWSAEALDKAVAELRAAIAEESSAAKSEADRKALRDRWMGRKG